MEVESVMITGTNRGIGLESVKQLVKLPQPPRFVFATYRDESTTQALKEIRDASKNTQVVLIKMDVMKMNDIRDAQKIVESKLGDKGLNLLINNAGVLKLQELSQITEEELLLHFRTNTAGPILVLKEMLPLLKKSADRQIHGMNVSRAAVLNLSLAGGSVAALQEWQPDLFSNRFLDGISYRASKAALNMAMRVIASKIKDQGILVVNLWIGRTNHHLATEQNSRSVSEGVSGMLTMMHRLNESHHGALVDRYGQIVPF